MEKQGYAKRFSELVVWKESRELSRELFEASQSFPDEEKFSLTDRLRHAVALSRRRGLQVGPILLGSAKPAHILVPSVTPRGIVNLTALAAADCALPDKAADDVAEQAS